MSCTAGGSTSAIGAAINCLALMVEFRLMGQPFTGLNGGPQFQFNESIQIPVETQADSRGAGVLIGADKGWFLARAANGDANIEPLRCALDH